MFSLEQWFSTLTVLGISLPYDQFQKQYEAWQYEKYLKWKR